MPKQLGCATLEVGDFAKAGVPATFTKTAGGASNKPGQGELFREKKKKNACGWGGGRGRGGIVFPAVGSERGGGKKVALRKPTKNRVCPNCEEGAVSAGEGAISKNCRAIPGVFDGGDFRALGPPGECGQKIVLSRALNNKGGPRFRKFPWRFFCTWGSAGRPSHAAGGFSALRPGHLCGGGWEKMFFGGDRGGLWPRPRGKKKSPWGRQHRSGAILPERGK